MRVNGDARRLFYGDIFGLPDGDINVVYLTKNVPIAWHRHQRQDDRLFLVSGELKLRLRDDHRDEWHYLIPAIDRLPFFIARNTWHGYEALDDNTVVLQFNGPGKWDGSDEERHPIDAEMPWDAPR